MAKKSGKSVPTTDEELLQYFEDNKVEVDPMADDPITPEDIQEEYEEQLKEAWDNSYLNPENYADEQERVDKLIHHDIPVVYPK